MRGVGDYVVIYDITCDKERYRVDKILKGFGFRIQKSVFECTLTKNLKNQLITQLKKLNVVTGFIKIYRCEYHQNGEEIGNADKIEERKYISFIV
ncbi:CRISPR-associated endonuclease Cas2 [bacterium]|nr:CRISPR-associated endonuclease Cas2 [bacterium]